MSAMATDTNQKVLPLAFPVVDKELGPSWGWFLVCLRTSIEHVIPNDGICIPNDGIALFLTDIKVPNAPFESGLEVRLEENMYITDIAFDMLLAISTQNLRTQL